MFALLGGVRFIVHLVTEGRVRTIRYAKGTREVLIVGAGEGGRLVVRELMRNPELRMRPVGFIDDDPRKRHLKDEYGLRVLGTTAQTDLERVLDEIEPDEVVIAIPSAPGTVRAAVVSACRQRGIPVRTTPTVFELLQDGGGQLRVTRQLREVRVEDILGREPVRMELERVGAYLSGKVVMVTGAGGSIGSELCRQIARVGPAQAGAGRPRRGQPLRDRARAHRGAARERDRAGAGRLQGGRAHARGAGRAPPRRSSSMRPPTNTSR